MGDQKQLTVHQWMEGRGIRVDTDHNSGQLQFKRTGVSPKAAEVLKRLAGTRPLIAIYVDKRGYTGLEEYPEQATIFALFEDRLVLVHDRYQLAAGSDEREVNGQIYPKSQLLGISERWTLKTNFQRRPVVEEGNWEARPTIGVELRFAGSHPVTVPVPDPIEDQTLIRFKKFLNALLAW